MYDKYPSLNHTTQAAGKISKDRAAKLSPFNRNLIHAFFDVSLN
jgi:hypothetical protein